MGCLNVKPMTRRRGSVVSGVWCAAGDSIPLGWWLFALCGTVPECRPGLALSALGRRLESRREREEALPSEKCGEDSGSPLATFRSKSTSFRDNERYSPTESPLTPIGPTAIRCSDITLCPSLASIRRISRFFPSANTSSSTLAWPWRPISRARLALTLPLDSQTPAVSLARISGSGDPATSAVELLDTEPGMSEPVGELAVVGQDD